MCGPINIDPKLCSNICEFFGIDFTALGNDRLCPSQTVSTKINPIGNFHQLNARWGRKPVRSKRLLINTQSETITKNNNIYIKIQITSHF